jgi:hypothetical protein
VGLQYTFTFEAPLPKAATFVVDPDELALSSPLGAFRGGRLAVPAGCEALTVTLTSEEEVR